MGLVEIGFSGDFMLSGNLGKLAWISEEETIHEREIKGEEKSSAKKKFVKRWKGTCARRC
ncbi:hypothetical protein LguiB_032129 [Lonicera macranthoides]